MMLLPKPLKMNEFHDRDVVFTSLVGSWNYNMNDEHSDADYKAFVVPTFKDLYDNNKFSMAFTSEEMDYTVHDIREVVRLWYKSNINFLEVLFSKSMYVNPKYQEFMNLLLAYKNDIAAINVPYLFSACIGMSYNKMKRLHKYTSSSEFMKEKYGYNTKEACHAIRVLLFLDKYEHGKFKNFEDVLRNTDSNSSLDFLFDIKHGKFDEEAILTYYKFYQDKAKQKEKNLTVKPNEHLKIMLEKWVFNLVKEQIEGGSYEK